MARTHVARKPVTRNTAARNEEEAPEESTQKVKVGKPSKAPVGQLNTYDEEMAAIARRRASAEAKSAGGDYISTKGGILSINGNVIDGNCFNAVVVESVFSNAFYEHPYDERNPVPPDCYAFAEDEEGLAPHEECQTAQHPQCAGCPNNAYGTARVGRGKACRNQRRLAVIAEDADEGFADSGAQMYILSVAPTSLKAWASYVQNVYSTMKKDVSQVVTEITLFTPKGQTYSQLSFNYVRPLTVEEQGAVLPRRDEAMRIMTVPYPKPEETAPAAKRPANKRPAQEPSAPAAPRKFQTRR